tara:strand:- start:428 stop:1318 length:891 start_codon:yes stop_codon:yes gene_type:complete
MICFISHDRGGSEYLYEYIKKYKIKKKIFCLKGPAYKFFKTKIKNLKNFSIINIKKYKIKKIITSTSFINFHHIEGIKFAKKEKIQSYSILDDWNDYKKRFTYNKKLFLPNYIIVYNKYAHKLAKSDFPNQKIILLEDLFLKNIIKKLNIKKKKKRLPKNSKYSRILYLSDPIELNTSSKSKMKLYNEKNVISYMCKNIYKIAKNYKITVRMHPKCIKDKLIIKKYFKMNNLKINFSNKKNLISDILDHDIILGCETQALIPAHYSKKRVFCVIPNYVKKENKLKHLKIKELRNIK